MSSLVTTDLAAPYAPSLALLTNLLKQPTQPKVQAFIKRYLDSLNRPWIQDAKGNIYSDPDPTRPKVWFVGHTDTVHREHVDHVELDIVRIEDWLMACWLGKSGKGPLAQTGIGGDDKCGVWAALEAATREAKGGAPVGIFFPVDEEIGCVGTRAFDFKLAASGRCFLQLDRRGDADAIEHTNGRHVWTPSFRELLAEPMKRFGFKPCHGSLTDIGEFAKETGKPCMNISSGYHDAHSSRETVNHVQAFNSLEFAYAVADAVEKFEGGFGELEKDKPWTGYTAGKTSNHAGGYYDGGAWGQDAFDTGFGFKDSRKPLTLPNKPRASAIATPEDAGSDVARRLAIDLQYPFDGVETLVSPDKVCVYRHTDGRLMSPLLGVQGAGIDVNGFAKNHAELITDGWTALDGERFMAVTIDGANEGDRWVIRTLISAIGPLVPTNIRKLVDSLKAQFEGLFRVPAMTKLPESTDAIKVTLITNCLRWRGVQSPSQYLSPRAAFNLAKPASACVTAENIVWIESYNPAGRLIEDCQVICDETAPEALAEAAAEGIAALK